MKSQPRPEADAIFHGTVTGDVTVIGGVHLDLLGTVLGNLMVEDSGTACVRGVVAEVVIDALSNDFAG
jgi:hypothetical protein